MSESEGAGHSRHHSRPRSRPAAITPTSSWPQGTAAARRRVARRSGPGSRNRPDRWASGWTRSRTPRTRRQLGTRTARFTLRQPSYGQRFRSGQVEGRPFVQAEDDRQGASGVARRPYVADFAPGAPDTDVWPGRTVIAATCLVEGVGRRSGAFSSDQTVLPMPPARGLTPQRWLRASTSCSPRPCSASGSGCLSSGRPEPASLTSRRSSPSVDECAMRIPTWRSLGAGACRAFVTSSERTSSAVCRRSSPAPQSPSTACSAARARGALRGRRDSRNAASFSVVTAAPWGSTASDQVTAYAVGLAPSRRACRAEYGPCNIECSRIARFTRTGNVWAASTVLW